MTPSQINYQPLLDVNKKVGSQTVRESFKGKFIFLWVGLLALGVIVTVISHSADGLLIVVLPYPVALRVLFNKYKNRAWENFAQLNNWQLDTITPKGTLLPPSLQFGHNQTFSPIIKAALSPTVSTDMFTYTCETGIAIPTNRFPNGLPANRNRQERIFTVARTQLPIALPHIILKSKRTYVDMHQDLPNHETLKLEGDFDKYFKLQIEQGQEVDALAIITPDVMQMLISYEQGEDVEIFGNGLYFIMGRDGRDYRNMQQLINSVVALSGPIIEHIKLTHPVAPSPQPAPAATPATTVQSPDNVGLPLTPPIVAASPPAAAPTGLATQPGQNLNGEQPNKL